MKDINIEINGYTIGSKELLSKTNIIISSGGKYGFIGKNGVGKSTILKVINEHPLLKDIDKLYISQETITDINKTVFQTVIESNTLLIKCFNRYNQLIANDILNENEEKELQLITEQLAELNFERESAKVYKILAGLGIDNTLNNKLLCEFSGGWKMRISLAAALYRNPQLLLADEISNHLSLEANIWLSNYLKNYKGTIIIISHDTSFLDNFVSHIIHLDNKLLKYYKGNYYTFNKQYNKDIKLAIKEADKIEKKIKELKMGGIKRKVELENFIKKNPLPYIPNNKTTYFDFGNIPSGYSNLITLDNISYKYDSSKDNIISNTDFNIAMMTRAVIVGENGSGKSTLMKLLAGHLEPSTGVRVIDDRIRIGYYNQHTVEELPLDKTPIEYLSSKYNLSQEIIRSWLGRNGLDGKTHKLQIQCLSGGQRVRVALTDLQLLKPHVLLLDEPTNHCDIYTIDSLIDSINNFNGGIVLISHNIDLISKTNCIIWEMCNNTCSQINFEDYINKCIDN